MPKPLLIAATAAAALSVPAIAARADAYQMTDADVVVVAPAPDHETARPFKPTWCGTVEKGGGTPGSLRRTFESWRTYGGDEGPGHLARYLCDSPDDPNVQRFAGFVIQEWMNQTGLPQKEATASFLARIDHERWRAQQKETCDKLAPGDEDAAETKETKGAYRAIYGCNSNPPAWIRRSYPKNLAWYLDRDADMPELLRAYLVFHALPDPALAKPGELGFNIALYHYALWSADARRLDGKRLADQLAADPGNEYQQWVARETFSTAVAEARAWQKIVAAATAKDADLKKVLVDVPEQAWNDWVALRTKEAAAFDDGIAFEQLANAPNLSAVKGCDDKLRPHVGKVLARLAPADPKAAMTAIMSDPVGGPLMERYIVCEGMLKNPALVGMLYPLYSASRGHRGPRAAVYLAVVDAASQIIADRPKFPIQARELVAPGYSPMPARALQLSGSELDSEIKGVVASIKKTDDGVLVVFKKESYQETDYACTPTHRIYAVRADGTVVYDEDCKVSGHHAVDTTPKPVVIPTVYAAAIDKGRLLVARPDRGRPSKAAADAFVALPVAVFDSKAMKKLTAVWGFAL